MFRNEEESDNFFKQLNCLHPSLKFTFEKEKNNCLPFLDVNVERTATGFETNVYRKPTFTGQYLRWESFSPTKQKTNLISTLVHRALMICTKSKLNEEIFFLFFIYFYLYIYPPDSQESDGGAIHRVSNYPDLLPEMPRYCCPLVIF